MTDTEDVVYAARALAQLAHRGQVDKAGRPYIEHPEAVADQLPEDDHTGRAVAWLHDVVEDTDVPLQMLARMVPADVYDAVIAITHLPHEPREDYYARVAANPLALRVKAADLATNTDPWRTRMLEPELRARLAVKYARAHDALGLTPPAPLVPEGRIPVTVGDIARRGEDEALIAWVGEGPQDVVAVFTKVARGYGSYRGTASTPGLVAYHGVHDEAVHLHSLPEEWTVVDAQWPDQ